MYLYAVGVGSNRLHGSHGRPALVVAAALVALDERFDLFDSSPILLNRATGGAGRDFANAAALVKSELGPAELLSQLKGIERAFGRRPGRRWATRVLDLDILLWSGGIVTTRTLQIPHPRLATRTFALLPLAAIAPHWLVANGRTVRHLNARLAQRRPAR